MRATVLPVIKGSGKISVRFLHREVTDYIVAHQFCDTISVSKCRLSLNE